WVDYNLMSSIPGLFVLGEANFSDHGANRLGASALMQGLADGYFVIPYTIGGYLAGNKLDAVSTESSEFSDSEKEMSEKTDKLLSIKGKKTVDDFHKELGKVMWEKCGMARSAEGLKEALKRIPEIREEFWENVTVSGSKGEFNQTLEKAMRVADFLEFGELMVTDALDREESCGGHFRSEHQSEEGEALRHDDKFCHVSAWEFQGVGSKPDFHKEELTFDNVKLATRSYK
ncbi:MAG: fumarate reductase/succinate dehydrogenase flavoprotein subunit, partial [Planctomycetes bacterium]|nr:fumarate reductase/succinate dehydrogenase flavoprotein subunit [Planctomycetota bacterium]